MAVRFSLPPPVKPLPVIIPLCISGFNAVYQNANILAESLIQRYVGTPAQIQGITIHPFKTAVHIKNINFTDTFNRPLLSFPSLAIKLSFPKAGWNDRAIVITAPSMQVTALLLHSQQGTQTNWTELAAIISQRNASTLQTPKDEADGEGNLCRFSFTVAKPIVNINSESGKALLPPMTLPQLHVTNAQVENATAVARLADDIVTKIIRTSGTSAFPKEFRKTARMWARKVSKGVVNDAINWSQANFETFRNRVRVVDEAVKILPGLQPFQVWTGRIDQTLDAFQWALSRLAREEPTDEGPTNQEQPSSPPSSARPPIAEQPINNHQFRELDED